VQLLWVNGHVELAEQAAAHVAALFRRNPRAVVALPTGATPRGMYEGLATLHRAGELSCREGRFFNLDEFVGLAPDSPCSYAAYLWRHFLRRVDANPARVRLLRGDVPDLEAECRAYDQAIEAAGGIDLAILGLGRNGHVAFIEPGSDLQSTTHVVTLAESTRRAQRQQFPNGEAVPRQGVTMGMRTIRAARALLLLVAGAEKEAGLAALRAGRLDAAWPVTALFDHPDLVVLADRASVPGGGAS
jgi:glucosamine-6-phosphate deaminase